MSPSGHNIGPNEGHKSAHNFHLRHIVAKLIQNIELQNLVLLKTDVHAKHDLDHAMLILTLLCK